jgi:hypothetical protein
MRATAVNDVPGGTFNDCRRGCTTTRSPRKIIVRERNATPTFRGSMKLRSLGRSHAHKINRGTLRSAEVNAPVVPLPLNGLRLNTKAREQTATQMLATASTKFFLAMFEGMRLLDCQRSLHQQAEPEKLFNQQSALNLSRDLFAILPLN